MTLIAVARFRLALAHTQSSDFVLFENEAASLKALALSDIEELLWEGRRIHARIDGHGLTRLAIDESDPLGIRAWTACHLPVDDWFHALPIVSTVADVRPSANSFFLTEYPVER